MKREASIRNDEMVPPDRGSSVQRRVHVLQETTRLQVHISAARVPSLLRRYLIKKIIDETFKSFKLSII
jgi:hypothetical protein